MTRTNHLDEDQPSCRISTVKLIDEDQSSCRISTEKVRGVREGKGGQEEGKSRKGRKGGREEQEDGKNAKTGNESNINLKLSNFRYHRNCFRDFRNFISRKMYFMPKSLQTPEMTANSKTVQARNGDSSVVHT